jgi:hypothetical protein
MLPGERPVITAVQNIGRAVPCVNLVVLAGQQKMRLLLNRSRNNAFQLVKFFAVPRNHRANRRVAKTG